jgi:adenosylmethionine-8-amino-7-oxononanoate aminotransferase
VSEKSNTARLTTQELALLDKRYLWHPFTQMGDWLKEEPLIIAAGDGSYLIDIEGRRYLDGVSSLWVNVHGHRKAELNRAISGQLGCVAHSTFLGLSNVPAILLAERLVKVAPPTLARVFYSDNGSTAVEVALKMAFQYWQQRESRGKNRLRMRRKTRFISFVNGYHGDTLGAVSVGGIDLFHQKFKPFLFPSITVTAPYCYRCPWGREYPSCQIYCLGEVEEVMARNRDTVAAVIIEPLIQAAAGMLVFPSGYTCGVQELARKHDILFIADEVATGFGRTGTMFACEQERVQPDLLAMAKGISGGYLPLAATLTTRDIFEAFLGEHAQQKAFYHGHTYTANPLACAVSLANLDLFDKEAILKKLSGKIAQMRQGLQRFWQLRHVGDVRQLGFMVGIELVQDRDTRKPYPYEDKVGIKVIQEARRRGLILRPLVDTIILMPPLSISGKEMEELLEITYDAIEQVTEKGLGIASLRSQ